MRCWSSFWCPPLGCLTSSFLAWHAQVFTYTWAQFVPKAQIGTRIGVEPEEVPQLSLVMKIDIAKTGPRPSQQKDSPGEFAPGESRWQAGRDRAACGCYGITGLLAGALLGLAAGAGIGASRFGAGLVVHLASPLADAGAEAGSAHLPLLPGAGGGARRGRGGVIRQNGLERGEVSIIRGGLQVREDLSHTAGIQARGSQEFVVHGDIGLLGGFAGGGGVQDIIAVEGDGAGLRVSGHAGAEGLSPLVLESFDVSFFGGQDIHDGLDRAELGDDGGIESARGVFAAVTVQSLSEGQSGGVGIKGSWGFSISLGVGAQGRAEEKGGGDQSQISFHTFADYFVVCYGVTTLGYVKSRPREDECSPRVRITVS
jgi:hypothetical protein